MCHRHQLGVPGNRLGMVQRFIDTFMGHLPRMHFIAVGLGQRQSAHSLQRIPSTGRSNTNEVIDSSSVESDWACP